MMSEASDSVLIHYKERGYVLFRDAINKDSLDEFEMKIVNYFNENCKANFNSLSDPAIADFLLKNREMERYLYDNVRTHDWIFEFAKDKSIVSHVRLLLGGEFGLLEKIPMRIDLPMVIRELAVWHQDYAYVKGNTNTITAWIPMQDTPYEVGCLMIMPESHKSGFIAHDKQLLQKKRVPGNIFENEVRYVEMKRGDLLLFNSLLLHSSGLNISDRSRISLQARYSRLDEKTDPSMGNLVPVEH